jgi:hypothetical protein
MLIKLQLTIGFLGGILESRRDCEQVGTSKSIGWSWLIIISLSRKLPLKGCTQFPDRLIWEHPCIYIFSILIYHTHIYIHIYIHIYTSLYIHFSGEDPKHPKVAKPSMVSWFLRPSLILLAVLLVRATDEIHSFWGRKSYLGWWCR